MGLAHQVGNSVTLSYRQTAFSRIKDRNAKRMEDFVRRGKINVLFNSNPIEFRHDSVVLEVNGTQQPLPNDFVWIFAGGEPPTAFLKKLGISFGERDVTRDGMRAATEAAKDKTALVPA
jgi:thioredoxin reductase (NADPH)